MRVALLYPEVYDMARFKEARKEFPPFGVLYLAAVIEQAGHEAVIEAVTPTRTTFDLTGFHAVGFSLASSATYGLMLAARQTSVFASDCLVMVGGVHANFYPTESLVDFDAHVVADGESEEIILDLLHRSAEFGRDFSGIPGIYWRDATGHVIQGPPRALMRNIDELPLPARHLLPRQNVVMSDRLAGTDTEMAHVMFSRGCPFPCAFCAAAQSRIQYRGAASARRELEHLINVYGIEGFAIVDDNFIVHKGKVAAICDEIADLGLRWSALSRVDTVDAPLLKKMAAAGCIEIKYGMESGSEPLLKAMRKNTRRAQISNAVRIPPTRGYVPSWKPPGVPRADLDRAPFGDRRCAASLPTGGCILSGSERLMTGLDERAGRLLAWASGVGGEVLDPGAMVVFGLFGAECRFEVDPLPVGDGGHQD